MDPHERPPESIRALHKSYQKATPTSAASDTCIFDPVNNHYAGFLPSSTAMDFLSLPAEIIQVITDFSGGHSIGSLSEIEVYEHPDLPGLIIYPSLLPRLTQIHLLNLLLHRDLSNPFHQTNLHLHHTLPYTDPPLSFFDPNHPATPLLPHSPAQHKPVSLRIALQRKLHWATLGGQYDWTAKTYPRGSPPAFPADIAALISGLFPEIVPQAAIVNVYGQRDALSLHRDVAEDCARPLVSISLGCEALFIAGLEHCGGAVGGDGGSAPSPEEGSDAAANGNSAAGKRTRAAVLRLRSGDVLVMRGPARYAWHSVPKVLGGTCPEWLADWPCGRVIADGEQQDAERYEAWRGWMAGKRVNLNVRQMFDANHTDA